MSVDHLTMVLMLMLQVVPLDFSVRKKKKINLNLRKKDEILQKQKLARTTKKLQQLFEFLSQMEDFFFFLQNTKPNKPTSLKKKKT